MERFRESALNSTATLPEDTVTVTYIQKGDASAIIKKKVQAYLLYDKFEKYLIKRNQKPGSKFVNHPQPATGVFQKFFQLRNEEMKNKNGFTPWIEKLLKTSIRKDRYFCVWRIHVPYLINVKHLSSEQTFDIVKKWLIKCDKIKPVEFDIDSKINSVLRYVGDYRPIGPDTLKELNEELYNILGPFKQGVE